jgi:hypothetical protein
MRVIQKSKHRADNRRANNLYDRQTVNRINYRLSKI